MKLFDLSVSPDDLILLSKADYYGSCADAYQNIEKELREKLSEYRRRMSMPYVKGEDLIAAGAVPGPELGEALIYARKLRLAGIDKKEALTQTMGFLKHLQTVTDRTGK